MAITLEDTLMLWKDYLVLSSSRRTKMIWQIEATALKNSNLVDAYDYHTWGPHNWGSVSDSEVGALHCIMSKEGFRAGVLNSIRSSLDNQGMNVPTRLLFLKDIHDSLEFVWAEVHDKEFIDDEFIPSMFVRLQEVRKWLSPQDELTPEEELRFLLLTSYLPAYGYFEQFGELVGFVKNHNLDETRLALQRREVNRDARLIETEAAVNTGNPSLAIGAL